MSEEDWLVLVEVKYKRDELMGSPEEMIDKRKIAQVKRTGESYLVQKGLEKVYQKYRVDAVCILGETLKHYVNIS